MVSITGIGGGLPYGSSQQSSNTDETETEQDGVTAPTDEGEASAGSGQAQSSPDSDGSTSTALATQTLSASDQPIATTASEESVVVARASETSSTQLAGERRAPDEDTARSYAEAARERARSEQIIGRLADIVTSLSESDRDKPFSTVNQQVAAQTGKVGQPVTVVGEPMDKLA